MVDYKKFKPVFPLTNKGRFLVAGIRLLFNIRKLLGFTQWQEPADGYHEDPSRASLADQVYFGYKYYFKGLAKAEKNSGLESYFASQSLQLDIPSDFAPGVTITMSAGGDLIPYKALTPGCCRHLWDEAGDYFFNNDIVFANLETIAAMDKPYSAAPEVMLNDMFFNIDKATFNIFSGNGKYRGYDVLSTANNHSLDLGVEGVLTTQKFLVNKQIAFAGTAASGNALHDFPIIDRQGVKIAFLGYTYSLNKEVLPADKPWLVNLLDLNIPGVDLSLITTQAGIARDRGADIIVAALHMGCAYQAFPSEHIVDNMHRIANEADIDVLIGGHPHNPQPMEIFKNKAGKQRIIIYSLGDFIAYDIYKWCHLPLILKLHISKGKVGEKEVTVISKIELKPFYMHYSKSGELRLRDFLNLEKDFTTELPETYAREEFEELQDFFHSFIVTEKQEHILAGE